MAPQSGCKVDRVIRKYGLADPRHNSVNEGLLARWRGTDTHQEQGYRRLTAWFNKRLLRTVYEEHGRNALSHRIDADYEALTGDEDLLQQEVKADLRTDGIDASAVVSDLISYGTLRKHLLDCLDGEKSTESSSTDWEGESIVIARSVAEEKAQAALSSLVSDGELDEGNGVSVDVEIQLRCESCPTVVPFDVAARRGYVCDTHSNQAQSIVSDQS